MDILDIAATKSTPRVLFNPSTHICMMIGESYPENSAVFYTPVFEWIHEFLANLEDNKAVFKFNLIYFNSSTSKALMDLFEIFEKHVDGGKQIEVEWYHHPEDEAALEYGEEFKEDVESLSFAIVAQEDPLE